MSVKVTDYTATVKGQISSRASIALRFMLDAVDRTSEPNTPKDKGDLRRNKIKQVLRLHAIIVWKQKYAAPQEDKEHVNYTTAGTGAHYAENAVKTVVRDAAKYFRRAGAA